MMKSNSDSGFTLFEVLVSLMIMALMVSVMAPAFVGHLQYNARAMIRTESMHAAQRILDDLRFKKISSLPTSGTQGPTDLTIGKHTFNVYSSFCLNAALCAGANVRHITATVYYAGDKVYETETVYTKLN